MTILHAALVGVLSGVLGTTGVYIWINSKQDPTISIIDSQQKTLTELATIQSKLDAEKVDIQKNLTNTDLLAVSCSADWMKENGDLLCREMFCRLQTREGDAASQDECEQIANVANSLTIIKVCSTSPAGIDKCIELIGKRK